MAILNATTMQRDRVNLGWSVPVQKCQQIFETVAARHRSTLHYCLSRYGIVSQSLQSPQMSLQHLSPCGLVPMARRGRSAPLKPMRSTPDLAFLVRVLASVDLPPNLIQDFASLSMRPRTLGSLMNEERRHSRFRGLAPPDGESLPRPSRDRSLSHRARIRAVVGDGSSLSPMFFGCVR